MILIGTVCMMDVNRFVMCYRRFATIGNTTSFIVHGFFGCGAVFDDHLEWHLCDGSSNTALRCLVYKDDGIRLMVCLHLYGLSICLRYVHWLLRCIIVLSPTSRP